MEVIPEGAMLRLGMTNPPYILEHLEVRESHIDTLTHVPSTDHVIASGSSYKLHFEPLSRVSVVSQSRERMRLAKLLSLSFYPIDVCVLPQYLINVCVHVCVRVCANVYLTGLERVGL